MFIIGHIFISWLNYKLFELLNIVCTVTIRCSCWLFNSFNWLLV